MKHEGLPFAMVPIEAFIDQRLTLTQHRVLGALLSFRGRDTEIIWPSREALSARTGLAVEKISNATTALCKLGWLTKDGCGGRSRSCRYRITVPDELTVRASAAINGENNTVPESGTVTHNTVPESGTVKSRNGARIGHETVPKSGTGIEETKNIPEKKELSLSLFSPSSATATPTTHALALVPPVANPVISEGVEATNPVTHDPVTTTNPVINEGVNPSAHEVVKTPTPSPMTVNPFTHDARNKGMNMGKKKELSLSLSPPSSDPAAPTTQALALVPPVAKVATDWPGFEEFWAVYPRKEAKKATRVLWNKLRLPPETIAAILVDVPLRKSQHSVWQDVKFIPHPSSYLNGERWQDSIIPKLNGSHHVPRQTAAEKYERLFEGIPLDLFGNPDRPNERVVIGETLPSNAN